MSTDAETIVALRKELADAKGILKTVEQMAMLDAEERAKPTKYEVTHIDLVCLAKDHVVVFKAEYACGSDGEGWRLIAPSGRKSVFYETVEDVENHLEDGSVQWEELL